VGLKPAPPLWNTAKTKRISRMVAWGLSLEKLLSAAT
jgi:hypothetical protein